MPGVPSGRGCEACRRQKKKCDQAKPACSRCARLRIQCVGAGVQRFQFKQHKTSPEQSTANSSERSTVLFQQPAAPPTLQVSYEFMQALQKDDLRYDLNVYGHFLHGVPRRLGNSKALDASAAAVIKCLAAYQRRQFSCLQALTSYGHALAALRTSLADPATAHSADTLCSMYLVLLCQGWLGESEVQTLKHGEAIAFVLQKASTRPFEGEFESWLVITLIVPVVMEAVTNPRITLGPWLDRLMDKYVDELYAEQGTSPYKSYTLRNFVRIPAIIRDPARHIPYVGFAYETVKSDVAHMRKSYAEAQRIYHAGTESAKMARQNLRMYGTQQTVAGIVLMMATLFAGLLVADDPNNTAVAEELVVYRQEALALAKAAAIHRPFGASYMTLLLVVAWASSEDAEEMVELWAEIEDYASDFSDGGWQQRPLWLRGVFDSLRLNRLAQASGAITRPEPETDTYVDYCVVM